ncbi:hypothetical protein [Pontivivens insulae]|uniref:Uncharacterized protein n=1 Tax=Pontivivens insulae TaxID=1639689 RepID=A0A2R8A986_9RHOB|nr:hypothetical protein [Pontivivens insulae]RED12701.1 hypothetical protein DFR53_1830 [Pontivivens insulae]SPF28792.1 hypothetical protein POI8812_01095 [Pontivivens insulae]
MARLKGRWGLALLAALAWTVLAILVARSEGLSLLVTLVAILVPVLLIAMLGKLAQDIETFREDSADLVDLLDEMQERKSGAPKVTADSASPAFQETLNKLIERQNLTDRALKALLEGREADRTTLQEVAQNTARATTPRPTVKPAASGVPGQPTLPLEAPAADESAAAPGMPDILRALNFPADADDTAGFRAMRRAMADRPVAQLLRAAEDVLNLLAQDGIYTDDIEPSPTDVALWRRFAHGERGEEMAALAGMTDTSALALTRARMRQDEVMRDAALHFMRRFDLMLRDRADDMTDGEVERAIDSRSGRAFMLIAAVTGTFE